MGHTSDPHHELETHLNTCAACQAQPFGLCRTGSELLQQVTATVPSEGEASARGGGTEVAPEDPSSVRRRPSSVELKRCERANGSI
jgi:hypothetical protein